MGEAPRSVARFPTGSSHFVFDIETTGGRRAVLRLARRAEIEAARGAVYWSRALRPIGVPLPALLHADLSLTRYPFPVVLLERLRGNDLGSVYRHLSRDALRALAERLAAVQDVVARLPPGAGFGYATSRDGPFPQRTWRGVVAANLARSRTRIRAAGIVDERLVDPAVAAAERFGYLDRVAATPFLHDITTKNVIIHEGRLSGIVDVDDLCFGDPLLLVALIRMALLAHELDQAYFDMWVGIVRPDAEQRAAIDLYTLQCCVDFMSELGQRFNRSDAAVDPAYRARLRALYDDLLARVEAGMA
jgi:hypothetical protein